MLLGSNQVDTTAMDKLGLNALFIVCFNYHGKNLLEIVKLLIRYKIDVNNLSGFGWNPLFALCSNGGLLDDRIFEIVQTLVNAGLDIKAKALNGENMLVSFTERYCSHIDFTKMVQFVIEKGLEINVKNTKGETMGLIAVGILKKSGFLKDDSDIVKLFLSQ